MKKLFLKSLALLMMLTMSVSMWAESYCHTLISNGSKSIYMTCSPTDNANEYQILFEGTDEVKLTGTNLVNVGMNDINGQPGGNALSFVTDATGNGSVKATFTSATTPGVPYVAALFFATSVGEVAFNPFPTDMDWAECVGGDPTPGPGPEPEPEPEPEPTTIDWSTISWVGASGDKFKVAAADDANLPGVGTVQKPGWAAKDGIYLTFPAAGITCSHNCAVDGAGICLYIDQFVAKETEVTVNYAGGSKTFVVYYADGIEDLDAEIPSEYCRAAFSSGNTACRISWVTLDNGNVEITLFEPDGTVDAEKTHFRGNGVNIARLTVGGEDAAIYFNSNVNATSNVQTLTLKNPAVKPAKGAKFAYPNSTVEYAVVKDGNAWPSLAFNYTYGGVCVALDAPANVAVADNGTITFDAVDGAETYEAHVFDGSNEVYVGTVTNGGVIDYQVYVAKTLTVKVVAKSSAKADSEFSDAATWNAAASPLPASAWCERAGVVTAANECCHAAFSINTLADGSVAIVIGATEGTPEGAAFRGAKGMNGTFTLNGSAADFTACFTPSLSADKKTVTLALNGAAPALGSIIDYSGQIEAASSLHTNDWSNYDIKGYIYGTKCATDLPVTGVALSQTTATIYVGDAALVLSPIFTPSNAGNKNVTWATSADAVATVVDGQVTAVAPGEATITVTTEDGGFQATCVVTVKAAIEAPTAPTWDAAVVKAVYSATYGADFTFDAWGSGTQYTQKAAGKYFVGGAYFGMTGFGLNCAAMDHYHMDVYPMQDMTIRVVPIWGGAEQGVTTATLTAGQWNSVDIEMSAWNTITNWTNIYQIKLDQFGAGQAFYLNNVYFYRESADVDTEAPVMTSASLVSTSFLNAVLAVEATDNVAVTQYLVKNGEAELGKFAPADGKITVTGLAMGTAYTLSVYALDAADNVSENKKDVELTTVAGPAPVAAPTYDAADVIALYSDAYSTIAYNIGGWGQTTHQEDMEIAAGEHALLMTNCNYQGWEFATQDLSGMTHVHFDVYVAEATTIQFTPIWGGEAVHTFNLVAGWNSIEAPLTLTWPAINLTNVYQIKFAVMPATCWIDNVFFVHKIVAVESISLDKTALTLAPEASETLVATVNPVDATNKNFTWATDNAEVATVVDGVVTAVAEGTANITATTEDGEKVATCVVTVAVTHATGVSLNKTAITLAPEATETLVATVAPADAANKNVTWATDNAEVATVVDGVVTAVAEGTANITVTTEDGSFQATCVVTVENPDVVGPDEVMLEANGHKIFYTAYKYACGVYELTIRSNETLAGFGGSFFNPGNVDVRSVAQKAGDKLVVTIKDAASDPQFYTPLFVMMPGEVNFGSITIDWIAKNPVATASSEVGANTAENALVEGGRWESASTDTEWWMVNYNHKHNFNAVKMKWEGAYAKEFTIEGSNDGTNFDVIYTESNGSAGEHLYNLDAAVDYQYVKVNITKRGTGWGNSIIYFEAFTAVTSVLTTLTMTAAKAYTAIGQGVALTLAAKDQYNAPMAEFGEVEYTVTPAAAGEVVAGQFVPAQAGNATIAAHVGEVYANTVEVYVITENVNLALSTNIESDNKIVAQSDKGEKGTDAFYAVNGSEAEPYWQGSPWNADSPETGHVYDSWFVVDLGDKFDLELITIHFEGACSRHYHVDASLDNAAWTTIDNGGSGQQNYTALHAISETTARYVRFWSTEAATGWGMKVIEFQVFGQRNTADDVHVTAVSLNKTATSLVEGAQETLVATVTPDEATNKACIWTSNNMAVATVVDGVITAVAPGEATITAKSADNEEALATCVVTVTADLSKPQEAAPAVATDGVEIRAIYTDDVTLAIAHDFGFNPWGGAPVSKQVVAANNYLLIDGATANNITLGVNNDGDNAIIAKDGMSDPENAEHKGLYVAGMKYCHIDIWSQVAKDNVKVLINDRALTSINLTDEGWQSFDIELVAGDMDAAANVRWMKVIDLPTGTKLAIDNIYFWKSNGTAAVTGVSLNKSEATIDVAEELTLIATVEPAAAGNKNIIWSSSNDEIATVVGGVVTGVDEGDAVITAETEDGGFQATCSIHVVAPVAKTWYGYAEKNDFGFEYAITYNVNKTVTIVITRYGDESKPGLVAPSFSIDGEWKDCVKDGDVWTRTTTKTFTKGQTVACFIQNNYSGGQSDPHFSYTVGSENSKPVVDVTSVVLSKTSAVLLPGKSLTLTATAMPGNATDKSIVWGTSNAEVVTVADGVITAVAVGEADITATAANGVQATCHVSVVAEMPSMAVADEVTIGAVNFRYSITYNADMTLTYAVNVHGEGVTVYQVNDGAYHNLIDNGSGIRTYTTTETYNHGDKVHVFFHFPARYDLDYTVGDGAIVIKEAAENASALNALNGQTTNLVINRTMAENDQWKTICLPFDMTAAQIEATFGADAEVRELGYAYMKTEDMMHIQYDLVDNIVAGHPYIIKTPTGLPALFFENITVDATASTVAAQGGIIQMVGTFFKTTVPAGPDYLYLDAADGYLHCWDPNKEKAAAPLAMKAFRCYFQFIGEAAAAVQSGSPLRARVVMGENATTELENVESAKLAEKILRNGQLVIIRGEREYNACGQIIR